jgi:hypothetical protein
VTKDWLTKQIEIAPALVIGRALVAIFKLQTFEEKASNVTKFHNGIGFSANDARLGCIGAKYYLKHGTLTEGLMKGWLKKDKKGLPRITKYANQLNRIAMNNKIPNTQNENDNKDHSRVP